MPVGLALGDKGEILATDIAMDGGPANTIRAIDASTGAIRTLAGKPHVGPGVTMVDGAYDKAIFGLPWAMARLGAAVYVTDLLGHAVRSVDVATGAVTTFAGKLGEEGFVDAAGDKARFRLDFGNYGAGSGIATDGTNLYVADTGNFAIRKILPNKDVVTLAGGTEGSADGTGTGAQFMAPSAVAYANGFLYVVDHKDYTIRRVDVATGEVKTIVGIAGKATGVDGGVGVGTLAGSLGVAADGFGSLYVTDLSPTSRLRGAVVRRVDLSARTIGPFAGTPRRLGLAVGPLPSTVNMPIGLVFDENGDLLFADDMDGAVGAIKPL
jgi:DNA-binding beta-propeller fold protein YncE